MIIKNVKVFTEENKFENGEIYIENGLFAEKAVDDEIIDGEGAYAVPGFIDTHFHGCMGYDFCDNSKKAIEEIAKYEAAVGVTAICPATMTLPVDELNSILATAAEYSQEKHEGADLIGVNMEGPFISKLKKGAQDAKNIISCNEAVCQSFIDSSKGLVKIVGIAPEESENAVEYIENVKDKISVSLAHTNADYDTAMKAFNAGANRAIHLYNAMPAFTHRAPGVVGAVFDSKNAMAELICDGVHIHPSTVRATFEMMGADRMILISDSMRAAGMPDGRYTLGGLDVDVVGNRATLVSDGALAGSVTNLADCVRVAVKQMNIPLEDAIAAATANPAKSIGVYDKYGSITVGKKANVVLLNNDLSLKTVIKDGKRI